MIEFKVYYRNPGSPDGIKTVLKTTIMQKAFDRAKETANEVNRIVAISALDFNNCKLKYSFVYLLLLQLWLLHFRLFQGLHYYLF